MILRRISSKVGRSLRGGNMKKFLVFIRPYDVLIISLLVIISFIPLAVFNKYSQNIANKLGNIAVISIDGVTVREIELSSNTKYQLFTLYPSENQYNIIEVDGTRIRNKKDNSPDQIAVKTGWISKVGETSICLPHKLIIEIRSKDGEKQNETDLVIPL